MTNLIGQITVKSAWKSLIVSQWFQSIGRHWSDREYPHRCDYCGRRLWGIDEVAIFNGNGFSVICLNHGKYDGEVTYDAFTGCKVTLKKERALYHQGAIFHEMAFYLASIIRFVRLFFRELPLNILNTLEWVIRQAAKRQRERLNNGND